MMKNTDIKSLQSRIETLMPTLNEYQRRCFLSAEARVIGYGRISLVSRLSGVSRQTLTEGVQELEDPDRKIMPVGRSLKSGGGAKHVWEAQAGLLDALADLVSAHTKGDPERVLLWTNKSLRNLEKGLSCLGYTACYRVVGIMLTMLGYDLQRMNRPFHTESKGRKRLWRLKAPVAE